MNIHEGKAEMTRILKFLVAMINKAHDLIVDSAHAMGLGLNDKQLHFWLMGFLGVGIFAVCDYLFRRLAKWSISAISFIYALTIMIVGVMAVEIEQKVTGAGSMEFDDVTAGLSGFLMLSALIFLIRVLLKEFKRNG